MKIIQQTNKNAKQSMGYEIIAETGQLLVIDGGYSGNEEELRRIIKSAGGHVDLWLITHPHCDHHNAVIGVLSDPQGITVDKIGTSMLPDSWAEGKKDAEELLEWNRFERTLNNVFQIQEGQIFQLGSLRVEVLAGANPDLEIDPFNNQSCVFRVSEEDFSLLILGDLGVEAGRRLLQKGYDLKADAVQMAHHGQNGAEEEVYQAIQPEWAFWPTPKWLWENTPYMGGTPGTGPFKTPEVIEWMKKLGTKNITCFDHTVMFDTKTKKAVEY
jgi:putative metallo-beta-lactamase domain protein